MPGASENSEAKLLVGLLLGYSSAVLSSVRLFATPWTVARQAPLSMEFSRQEYCSGLSFPSLEDLLDPEIKPESLVSPALAGGSLLLCPKSSTSSLILVPYIQHKIAFLRIF